VKSCGGSIDVADRRVFFLVRRGSEKVLGLISSDESLLARLAGGVASCSSWMAEAFVLPNVHWTAGMRR
jgi:hypothetical protein